MVGSRERWAWSVLMATLRRDVPSGCSPSYTAPIPPSPRRRITLYLPPSVCPTSLSGPVEAPPGEAPLAMPAGEASPAIAAGDAGPCSGIGAVERAAPHDGQK